MASAQEPSLIKVYLVEPNGKRYKVYEDRVENVGFGGSADGTIAKDPDTWKVVSVNPNVTAYGGWKVIMTATLDSADGVDASDCQILIPVVMKSTGISEPSTSTTLNATNLGFTTDFPAGTIASNEIDCGAGYTVPNGKSLRFGGGRIFISIEDDTG